MAHALSTIGYEAKTQDQMIAALKSAGVEMVVDVRAVAASRRPGFSKTMLAAGLAEAGIAYEHLRGLGTPKAGRDAARAGRTAEMRAIFEDHLAEPQAQLQLARAVELAKARPVALLCYEAEACDCHRAVVAERICEVLDMPVENL
ncbi:DUF488 domain-containing protein [Phenylobacterium sp.]|uniref:DUF488 domain-containing protein n=1 Tax=Phenylobacterium sp. TaxID=1871053 RepID=UPI002FD8F677